jgi:2-phospho-L-lactate guanylyltransferase
MSLWAIVPVKPFMRAKSRLAPVLSAEQRAGLSRSFLQHALDVLSAVPLVHSILVISRDPGALALARQHGARTVTEAGAPDLNAALSRATQVAAASGASEVLILPTDLPFLTATEVAELVCASGPGPVVTIAPDRHEQGTNALFVRPPGLLAYAFGAGSFDRHQERARAAGAQVAVCRLAGAALDVDLPEDLRLYQQAVEKP